jgi:hypothetical protein
MLKKHGMLSVTGDIWNLLVTGAMSMRFPMIRDDTGTVLLARFSKIRPKHKNSRMILIQRV